MLAQMQGTERLTQGLHDATCRVIRLQARFQPQDVANCLCTYLWQSCLHLAESRHGQSATCTVLADAESCIALCCCP